MNFVFEPSLVLYLPLYELDGGSFASKDAYGHTCTVTGALWRPNGHYFDGADDKIIVPDQSAFNVGSQITVLTWINGAAQNQARVICQADYSISQLAWDMYCSSNAPNTKFMVAISDNGQWPGGHRKHYESSAAVYDETWHLIGFTFEGGTLRFYIDGQEDSPTKLVDDAITGIHDSTVDIVVGARTNGAGFQLYFTGKQGEDLVYNRALTPQEIQHNYLATKWRYR